MNAGPVMGAPRGMGLKWVRQVLAEGRRGMAAARDDAGLARLRDPGDELRRLDVALCGAGVIDSARATMSSAGKTFKQPTRHTTCC